MTNVKINDKEYDYDTFTEEQLNILKEINTCSTEVARANYTSQLFNDRHNILINALTESLNKDPDQMEMNVQ